MSAPVIYQLKHPITTVNRGGGQEREEQITEFTLRRIKAKDLRVTDDHAGDVAKTLALLARITGQPVLVIDELDAEDLTALQDKVEGFLPPGLLTGKTPSGT